MNKIGLLVSDLSGIYVFRQIRLARKDIDIDVLYDPIGYFEAMNKELIEIYIERNKKRFSSLGISSPIILHENWQYEGQNWESFVEKVIFRNSSKNLLCLKSNGDDPNILPSPILYHTVEDGLLQRNFTLHILKEYLSEIEEGWQGLILASPGYGYWRNQIQKFLGGIEVLDPVDEIIKSLPAQTNRKGIERFFWTKREFAFERSSAEILQETIKFRMFYSHPWLRGEQIPKKKDIKTWMDENRKQKKTSDH